MRWRKQLLLQALGVELATLHVLSYLASLAFAIFVLDVWITLTILEKQVAWKDPVRTAGQMISPPGLMLLLCVKLVALLVDLLSMEGASIIIASVLCTNASSTLTSYLVSMVSTSLLFLRLCLSSCVRRGRSALSTIGLTAKESTPSAVQLASRRTRKSPAASGSPLAKSSASNLPPSLEQNSRISDTMGKSGEESAMSSQEDAPPSSACKLLPQSDGGWKPLAESSKWLDTQRSATGRPSVTDAFSAANPLSTATTSSGKRYSSTTAEIERAKSTALIASGSPVPNGLIATNYGYATSSPWLNESAASGKNTGQDQTTSDPVAKWLHMAPKRFICLTCNGQIWNGYSHTCK